MSAEIVVRVEGLGKRYAVDGAGADVAVSGGALVAALKRRLPALRRDSERNWFWALRDASFELRRGEVLGIIGRNGAGKSTLLKVLAGIVAPTYGQATLIGRVGSLLEVGTGFHPDMTGRENVILSAALLGISKQDVLRRFDDIVDYAGVRSFIDVPVKRYSSGMYMRLAYSVTALLESDILLLDEVLAVGDAEFQKKTKRNVDSIAEGGRTVLFVSHSMASINELCTRCIWLDRGRIIADGTPEEITERYLASVITADRQVREAAATPRIDVTKHVGYHTVNRSLRCLRWIETQDESGTPTLHFMTGGGTRVRVGVADLPPRVTRLTVGFHALDGRRVSAAFYRHPDGAPPLPAQGVIECVIPEVKLVSGRYALTVEAAAENESGVEIVDSVSDATRIEVTLGTFLGYPGLIANHGYIAQRSQWANRPADIDEYPQT